MTGWQDEPEWLRKDPGPERAARLVPVASITIIALVVVAVVTIALLNKGGDTTGTPSVAGATPLPTSGSPTSGAPTTPTAPGTIDNPGAHLAYPVPDGWSATPSTKVEIDGVEFTGAAVYGRYQCEGSRYTRAFVVSAAVQKPSDAELTAEKAARSFATPFATKYYPGATVGEPTMRATQVDGKQAVVLTAPVQPKQQKPQCEANSGEIAILAVDLDNATPTTPRGFALLVVSSDLGGGPAEPKALPAAAIDALLDGAHVK